MLRPPPYINIRHSYFCRRYLQLQTKWVDQILIVSRSFVINGRGFLKLFSTSVLNLLSEHIF